MFHRHKWYIDYGHAGYGKLECAGCGKRRPNIMRWHERLWQFMIALVPGASRRRKEMIARLNVRRWDSEK